MKLGERLINYADDNDITYNHLCVKVLKINRQIMDDIINCDIYSAKIAKKIANILGPEYEQYIIPNRCTYCGKEFIGRLGVNYCSTSCNSKYWGCIKANRPLPRFAQTEEKKNKSIPKINQESRAMGLTYGQFVGLQKLKKQKEENEKRYKLFILDKKRVDELKEEIAKLAKWLSYSPEEIQRIFYDKDIYAINKSKRKKARKAFVKSCIEHSYENITSMISKAEVELAFVNERIAREEEAFNSYDKLGVWRLEAVTNDK